MFSDADGVSIFLLSFLGGFFLCLGGVGGLTGSLYSYLSSSESVPTNLSESVFFEDSELVVLLFFFFYWFFFGSFFLLLHRDEVI